MADLYYQPRKDVSAYLQLFLRSGTFVNTTTLTCTECKELPKMFQVSPYIYNISINVTVYHYHVIFFCGCRFYK